MGQAFRRASGRIRATSTSDAAASKPRLDRKPPPSSPAVEEASKVEELAASLDSDGASGRNTENVLEEKDPQYDAMLSQMVGRIRAKPGGKPEMGEATVVERYKRPLPKLRDTKPGASRYEERPTIPGTLNVAQIRQIILLHEGKAEDHDGPMDVPQIAERFRVDAEEVRKILQFVSLPPEDNKKDRNNF